MRELTCTQTHVAAAETGMSADLMAAPAVSQSALQLTRAAIARWSGSARPALVRDMPRVSPQARWVAQAQGGLAEWIARGGFSQQENDVVSPEDNYTTPTRYQLPAALPSQHLPSMNACID